VREHMGAVHVRAGLVAVAFGLTSVFVLAAVPASSAGTAGSSITPMACPQVPPQLGPVSGGYTGGIARIPSGGGSVKRIVSRLPSGKLSPQPPLSHVVAGMAVHLYIGVRQSYDVTAGSAVVWRYNARNNQLTIFANDLADLMGLTFGPDGTLVCS
jgi:hypothetical protein